MELEKARAKGKRSQPVFSLGWPERCRATREKRRGLEGSREARERELIMYAYWWLEERERERGKALLRWAMHVRGGESGERGRSPASLGFGARQEVAEERESWT